jgi:predicted dehydrogenase
MTATVRTALLGFGYAGKTLHAPLIATTPGLSLAAVGSSRPDAVHAVWPGLRVQADLPGLATAPDIDLVVIATPNDTHHALARAALEAGKAVVVDKPFTVTPSEALDLLDVARRFGGLLSVFHNRRWDGDFLTLRDLIDAGTLGEVREVVSRFDRFEPRPRDRWRENGGPGAGLWYDLGPHLIDQMLCLFGQPTHVSADIAALRDGARSDDWAQVVLAWPQRRATLHCTRLSARPAARFEFHGTQGSAHCEGLDVQEDQLKAGARPGDAGWGQDARPVWLSPGSWPPGEPVARPRRDGDWGAYYRGIAAALREGAPNPVPAGEALRVMQVLEAARTSAAQGRVVRLDAAD